jgi:hypothetical protein
LGLAARSNKRIKKIPTPTNIETVRFVIEISKLPIFKGIITF